MLAGAAGGIGAIFQAPLGAALFAPEVLYREPEFEYEAILPCVVSSIIAYAVYIQFYKGGALFFPGPVEFSLPTELLPYAIFGVVCALVGYVYVRVFYGARDRFFKPLKIHKMVKPALGGLMLGAIAYSFSADNGRWVRLDPDGVGRENPLGNDAPSGVPEDRGHLLSPSAPAEAEASSVRRCSSVPCLAGPSDSSDTRSHPGWVVHPNSFVLVGMGGFFAGVAKVPIASIIMACEMSASYTLLVPLMVVSSISYLLLREHEPLREAADQPVRLPRTPDRVRPGDAGTDPGRRKPSTPNRSR